MAQPEPPARCLRAGRFRRAPPPCAERGGRTPSSSLLLPTAQRDRLRPPSARRILAGRLPPGYNRLLGAAMNFRILGPFQGPRRRRRARRHSTACAAGDPPAPTRRSSQPSGSSRICTPWLLPTAANAGACRGCAKRRLATSLSPACGRLRRLHLRVERDEDVPHLLVDDRLQNAPPIGRTGPRIHVRLPGHLRRGTSPLSVNDVVMFMSAPTPGVERSELERTLLELRECDRHQPAEAQRYEPLQRPSRSSACRPRSRVVPASSFAIFTGSFITLQTISRGAFELLRALELHCVLTSTFARASSGWRSISKTRW